jgi:hypothetical protein
VTFGSSGFVAAGSVAGAFGVAAGLAAAAPGLTGCGGRVDGAATGAAGVFLSEAAGALPGALACVTGFAGAFTPGTFKLKFGTGDPGGPSPNTCFCASPIFMY